MNRIFLIFLSLLFSTLPSVSANHHNGPSEITIPLQEGEKIWSGTIREGPSMPLSTSHSFDFYANNIYNQIQPLLLSNKGLYVWSEEPYKFQITDTSIIISNIHGPVETGRSGNTLASAREHASQTFFPPSGKLPDPLLFSSPQYNTWIELTYYQNQDSILEYARAIIANGFPPGVFMIDDTWQEDYGVWNFHPARFSDPKGMIDELHAMGFKVMLWVCPFVSPDQYLICKELTQKKAFLMQQTTELQTWDEAKNPAIIKWWNGYSALLDFTNPEAVKWFDDQLKHLVDTYGVDGFKLDAGDTKFYPPDALSKELATPNRHCELYARIGLKYPLNEYRACWKLAGQPLAQRLFDKKHTWPALQTLIPSMNLEGLVGYTFSCPDMIGGGHFVSFLEGSTIDQELVVRSAQCHALMPMMQFSVAPWRILDQQHLDAVKSAVDTRTQFTPTIMKLAEHSAKTGEPIMCNLEYYFPHQGLAEIKDQFMLGENILVAPMVTPGTSRSITLPRGRWESDQGETYEGGRSYTIEVPLDRIPYFTKLP